MEVGIEEMDISVKSFQKFINKISFTNAKEKLRNVRLNYFGNQKGC